MSSHESKPQTAAWVFVILLALLCALLVDSIVGAVRPVTGIVHLTDAKAAQRQCLAQGNTFHLKPVKGGYNVSCNPPPKE